MAQILNIHSDDILSEVSMKCGDPFYRDFKKNIYQQAIYRSVRKIARMYHVLERQWRHETTLEETDAAFEIPISPVNFDKESKVLLLRAGTTAAIELSKVDNEVGVSDDSKDYYIRYALNQFVINYSNKIEGDVLLLYYASNVVGATDFEELDQNGNANAFPVLPDRFDEEIIKMSVAYVARLGVATFSQEKKSKYIDLLKLYSDETFNTELARNDTWIHIKPFQFP